MKSGGGVLVIAAAQLLVGLCILGIYEGKCTQSDAPRPVPSALAVFSMIGIKVDRMIKIYRLCLDAIIVNCRV